MIKDGFGGVFLVFMRDLRGMVFVSLAWIQGVYLVKWIGDVGILFSSLPEWQAISRVVLYLMGFGLRLHFQCVQ